MKCYSKEKVYDILKNKFPHLDFDVSLYNGEKSYITVICKEHGKTEMKFAYLRKSEYGCKICSQEASNNRYNNKKYYNRYKTRLQNKFPHLQFEDLEFIGAKNTIINFTCKKHGKQQGIYKKIVATKYGCPLCAIEGFKKKHYDKRQDIVEFLTLKHPYIDFTNCVYNGMKEKTAFVCKKHGIFESSYMLLLRGKNCCPKCASQDRKNTILKNKSVFIESIKKQYPNLDFSKFKYSGVNKKSTVICKKHGAFEVSKHTLIHGHGVFCPICIKESSVSKAEKEIFEYCQVIYDGFIESSNRNIVPSVKMGRFMELDIYMPDIKLAIEYNGTYWHSDKMIKSRTPFNTANEYHTYKKEKCFENGIDLIHISEDDYKKNKLEVLENLKYIIQKRVYNV